MSSDVIREREHANANQGGMEKCVPARVLTFITVQTAVKSATAKMKLLAPL